MGRLLNQRNMAETATRVTAYCRLIRIIQAVRCFVINAVVSPIAIVQTYLDGNAERLSRQKSYGRPMKDCFLLGLGE